MSKRTAPRTATEARAELRAARDWLKEATRQQRSACAGTSAAVRAALAPCAAAVRRAQAPCATAKRKTGAAKARTRAARVDVFNLTSEKRSKASREASEKSQDHWQEAVQAASPDDEALYSFVTRKYRRALAQRVAQAEKQGKQLRIDEAVAERLESHPEIVEEFAEFMRKKNTGHAATLRQHAAQLERENAALSRLLKKRGDGGFSFGPRDDDEIPF